MASTGTTSFVPPMLTRALSLAAARRRAASPTLVLVTMCLGVLLAQIDSTVVYLAVKHIGGELHASISQLQWVLDAYNLAYATFLLTGGTLGDLYGRRRIFVCGVGLILIGSLICAVAPNGMLLIAGRAVTGLGAALELPVSLSILAVTFPQPEARGRAIGFWASCNGLAMAIGPTVGGLLVDIASWRSIFLLSVPVALIAAAMALKYVPESSDPKGRRLDPTGQALAIVALATLAFVMIEAPHWGWTSPGIVAAASIMVISAAAFILVEKGRPGALVPLDVFGNAHFDASLAIAAMMTFAMYAMMFLTPLYLQSIAGASAMLAGLELVPMSLVFVVVSQFSGALMQRIGARLMMVGGMGCMGAGLLLLTTVSQAAELWLVEAALCVIGIGLGLNTGPVNAVAVASLPAPRSGTAAGLLNTARMVGATLGIAVLGAIFAVHAGQNSTEGMIAGLRLAYVGGAVSTLAGAVVAALFTRADSAKQKRSSR